MKIAVFSDSHDHIWHLRKAVKQANDLGAEAIVHCGDLISPFMLEELDDFQGQIHLVLGNNSGDQVLLTEACLARRGKVRLHGWLGRLDIEGVSLAWIHDPQVAYAIARSRDFQIVCYGHTHRWHLEHMDNTLLLNPGEILGKKEPPGWALVDTRDLRVRHILLSAT